MTRFPCLSPCFLIPPPARILMLPTSRIRSLPNRPLDLASPDRTLHVTVKPSASVEAAPPARLPLLVRGYNVKSPSTFITSVASAMTSSAVPTFSIHVPTSLLYLKPTVLAQLKRMLGRPNGVTKPSGPPSTVTLPPSPCPPTAVWPSYFVVIALALVVR